MTDREPAEVTNLDRYGNPELPWGRARDTLVPQTGFGVGAEEPYGAIRRRFR